eukprot:TRINITY_DN25125_c0_g1_i2.p3 TRINITY_DN25125_c0_g1~~TRINITY_DN25125_c0_g1_i2.p3  ORF type:complete len:102 (+),score=11.69 TRINITY_DN25125_c0_g1_i2:227-532(+)
MTRVKLRVHSSFRCVTHGAKPLGTTKPSVSRWFGHQTRIPSWSATSRCALRSRGLVQLQLQNLAIIGDAAAAGHLDGCMCSQPRQLPMRKLPSSILPVNNT